MTLGQYTLKYEDIKAKEKPNYYAVLVYLSVYKDGIYLDTVVPEKRWYNKFPEEPTSEVGLRRSLKEDLFIILAGLERDGTITLKGIINPLINWMWIGGMVAIFGGLYLLLPEGRKKRGSSNV